MNSPDGTKKYDHKAIEQKWQKAWEEQGIYKVKDQVPGKENFYQLVEFSYPSGDLHTGHWYAFAVPDIYARYKRMQGFNVLYPMGFDAFGLPAENAAIKNGGDPRDWTEKQMDRMRTQIKSMGAVFDWSREVVTCDPEYYKWTQWMFTQFFKHDLVYRASTKVNWCPNDQTILANEQVVDGKCDRCGGLVVQRDQEQWMLRITKYADRLIDDLESLEWPQAIKESQKNWIGRSEGSEIDFPIDGQPEHPIKVFTTRADTLFGVTFVAISSGLAKDWIGMGWPASSDIKDYIEKTIKEQSGVRDFKEKEKTGIYAGFNAINPATKEEVPVWITNYVLNDIGTGAIMGVPAHDERDADFAKKYNLPTKDVVSNNELLINSDKFDGLTIEEAKKKITEFVGGKITKTYRLRDWGISRQRYWGTPIPIVYDLEGKAHAVPEEHLPWLLPTDVDHTPDGTAPLARSVELFQRTEKIFGKGWKPEVETMDTFVDSSWYFYRYLDNKNEEEFTSSEKMSAWMPVDLYMGGAEHTTMHLLYSRFWVKALHDLKLVKENESYKIRRNRGLILAPDGNKMSKSKGNAISPDEIVERLGADTVRMYLAFMGPYGVTTNYPWDPNGVVGVRRFLERVWKIKEKVSEKAGPTNSIHKIIKKIGEDIEEHKYNTAIAQMMILMNEWDKQEKISLSEYKTLLELLAPFAPHITEELWYDLGETESIHLASWPIFDTAKVVDEEVTIGIQVNGKLRAEITLNKDESKESIEEKVLAMPKVQEYTTGKSIQKVVIVPNRIINIVISE